MKKLLLIPILLFASCSKESTYKAGCDIYMIKHFTYLDGSPLHKSEIYTNVTKKEAEDRLNQFRTKYTEDTKDTFAVLKKSYPTAFIDCTCGDIYR